MLLGGKEDVDVASELHKAFPTQTLNMCGKMSLNQSASIIKQSKKVITSDTGLMHIAAALHVPQVAIFGSSDPSHTPPNSAKATVISLHLPCSPCHQRECPLGHLNCLNQISPKRVFAALQ